MRKALIPVFLLVLGSVILGGTVFRDQVVQAATTPFQNVIVANTASNPVPVQQQGSSTVAGTVGIDPTKNTVKLDPLNNTVNLDSADSSTLGNIDATVSQLTFDSQGKLETSPQAAPSPVSQQCFSSPNPSDWEITNDNSFHTICSGDFYITSITAAKMDDFLLLRFMLNGNTVMDLEGNGVYNGSSDYQLDLTHPLHVDTIQGVCHNFSKHCNFELVVLGNTTGD